MKLSIVTASTDPFRTMKYWATWREHAYHKDFSLIMIVNGVGGKFNAHEEGFARQLGLNQGFGSPGDILQICDDYLGVIPAFALGVELALRETDAQVICCFHDDFGIREDNWDLVVLDHFARNPECYLAGFGGAMSVGREGMYDEGVEYDPMMLARHEFGSNLEDAATHGEIWVEPRRVAVLDGFSMIFRRTALNWFNFLARHGAVHHAYDVALSALVHQTGEEIWYLPIYGRHGGGQTAIGDGGYQEWAKTKHPEGDQGFWEDSHKIVYDLLRGILPYSIPDPVETTT